MLCLYDSTIMARSRKPVHRVAEGFADERLTILPRQAVDRFRRDAALRQLYPTRLGHFPTAVGHYVQRDAALDDHLLIHCERGAGYGKVGRTPFELAAGDVVWLPAGRPHVYATVTDQPWSISWVHFQGDRAKDYIRTLGLPRSEPVLSVGNSDAVRECFETLHGLTLGAYSQPTLLALHSGMVALCSVLARGRRELVPRRRERAERVTSVIRHLHANLHRHVSIEEMAGLAHWTPNHFSNAFREQVHQAPAAYFTGLKMARACEQLKTSDQTVAAIATELGFEDPFYFSRCFRRCYGVSPSAYRELSEGRDA